MAQEKRKLYPPVRETVSKVQPPDEKPRRSHDLHEVNAAINNSKRVQSYKRLRQLEAEKIIETIINRNAVYQDGTKRCTIVFDEHGQCIVVNLPNAAKISDEK